MRLLITGFLLELVRAIRSAKRNFSRMDLAGCVATLISDIRLMVGYSTIDGKTLASKPVYRLANF